MRLMLGLPWYKGPDEDTYPQYFDHQMYYGALRERSLVRQAIGPENFSKLLPLLPPLDEGQDALHRADPTEEEWTKLGKVEVVICNRGRLSLVGKAREMLVEDALELGADYLFCWDADMLFPAYTFLQLWRRQKPAVAALAYTAREPIHPVVYRMRWHEEQGMEVIDGSDVVLDFPMGELLGDDEIGGPLAFGTGVVLFDMKLFREMPKPWFNSTGCGEDWFFCHRAAKHGIPRYVDTSVEAEHKMHAPRWANSARYWRDRETQREAYQAVFGEAVRRVERGKVI